MIRPNSEPVPKDVWSKLAESLNNRQQLLASYTIISLGSRIQLAIIRYNSLFIVLYLRKDCFNGMLGRIRVHDKFAIVPWQSQDWG